MHAPIDQFVPLYPPRLPDLSFVSFAFQLHLLSGHHSQYKSLVEIFGCQTTLTSHFPHALVRFAARTHPDAPLNALTLLDRHTPYPYVRPFILNQSEEDFQRSLFLPSGKEASFHHRLFIKKSTGNLSQYEMRFCPLCVEADRKTFGLPYWHRTHQIPEVTVCHLHRRPLKTTCSTCGVIPYDPKLCSIPGCCRGCGKDLAILEGSDKLVDCTNPEWRISLLVSQIIKAGLAPLSRHRLQQVYVQRMSELGLATTGRILHNKLLEALNTHFGNYLLRSINNSNFTRSALPTYNWLDPLLCRSRPPTKPFHHCLLIDFLFGTFDRFLSRYHAASTSALDRKKSKAAQVAALVQTDIGPQRILPFRGAQDDLITKLDLLHQKGTSTAEIARNCGVHERVVKRYRTLNPQVNEMWEQAKLANQRIFYRAVIEDMARQRSGLTLAVIMRRRPAATKWLVTNDSKWLSTKVDSISTGQHSLPKPCIAGKANQPIGDPNSAAAAAPTAFYSLCAAQRKLIIFLLGNGDSIDSISRATGLHRRKIECVLALTAGLIQKREAAQFANRRDYYREKILHMLDKGNQLTLSSLSLFHPPMRIWVLANDYAWLSSTLATHAQTKRPPNRPTIRDSELAQEVRRAASTIAQKKPLVKVTRHHIGKLLNCPVLNEIRKNDNLRKTFPRTSKALEEVVESTETWMIRRIRTTITDMRSLGLLVTVTSVARRTAFCSSLKLMAKVMIGRLLYQAAVH